MELLGRELGMHWADFGNVEPNPNRTMPWSGRHKPTSGIVPPLGPGPRCSGMNRGHVGRRQIDPGVKGRPTIERIVARAEAALELIIIERHRQRQRLHKTARIAGLPRLGGSGGIQASVTYIIKASTCRTAFLSGIITEARDVIISPS